LWQTSMTRSPFFLGSEHLGAIKFRTERVGTLAIAVSKSFLVELPAAVNTSHPAAEAGNTSLSPSSPASVRDYIFSFIP
jgi:hypothetical protein